MNSSALSASSVADSLAVGLGEEVVGSGSFGVGSGSSEHPARSRGTTRVSERVRRTCMKVPSENNVSTAKTTH